MDSAEISRAVVYCDRLVPVHREDARMRAYSALYLCTGIGPLRTQTPMYVSSMFGFLDKVYELTLCLGTTTNLQLV